MNKYVMHISYLGTNYSGWQIQNNAQTIQGIISENPNVSCEIQIVMINDKNKVKDISKILHHPFFKLI